jgi:hypothetical protein
MNVANSFLPFEVPLKRWTVGAEPQLCVFIGEMMATLPGIEPVSQI